MNQREQKFESLRKDPWYGKLFPKLKSAGEKTCLDFIRANGDLAVKEWEMAVQRLFLDLEKKPTNWTLINEILIVCAKVSDKSQSLSKP